MSSLGHWRLAVELSRLSDLEIARLTEAATEVLGTLEALAEADLTPVGQVLRAVKHFTEDTHYPDGDVHDEITGAQYYYHAHRGADAENGHFHLFVRHRAIPVRMRPALLNCAPDRPLGDGAIAHIVAVSIGYDGLPKRLFTTNQWVTGETFYGAEDTSELASVFGLKSDRAYPETSRWLTALVALFLPQIRWLLLKRDDRIGGWARRHPSRDVLIDERLEITSQLAIDIDAQIAAIDAEDDRRKKAVRLHKSKPLA